LRIVLRSKNYEVSGCNKCTDIVKEVDLFSQCYIDGQLDPGKRWCNSHPADQNDLEFKKIPVIFFSANDRVDELATEAGAESFLQKPFEIDELETAVSKAVAIHRQEGISEIR
jgi:two-component system cell cycle response regulator DivK